jgi:hypothetical protein
MMVAVAQMQHAPVPPCPKCGRIGLPRGTEDGTFTGVVFCPWHDLYDANGLISVDSIRQMGPTVQERIEGEQAKT